MNRWETLTALLAVVLASLAALQIRGQLMLAILAIGLLALLGITRLRASMLKPRAPRTGDAAARATRIHEERQRRTGR